MAECPSILSATTIAPESLMSPRAPYCILAAAAATFRDLKNHLSMVLKPRASNLYEHLRWSSYVALDACAVVPCSVVPSNSIASENIAIGSGRGSDAFVRVSHRPIADSSDAVSCFADLAMPVASSSPAERDHCLRSEGVVFVADLLLDGFAAAIAAACAAGVEVLATCMFCLTYCVVWSESEGI